MTASHTPVRKREQLKVRWYGGGDREVRTVIGTGYCKVPALLVRVKKSNVDTPQWLDEAVILEQKWIENFQKHLENPVFWRRLTIV